MHRIYERNNATRKWHIVRMHYSLSGQRWVMLGNLRELELLRDLGGGKLVVLLLYYLSLRPKRYEKFCSFVWLSGRRIRGLTEAKSKVTIRTHRFVSWKFSGGCRHCSWTFSVVLHFQHSTRIHTKGTTILRFRIMHFSHIWKLCKFPSFLADSKVV